MPRPRRHQTLPAAALLLFASIGPAGAAEDPAFPAPFRDFAAELNARFAAGVTNHDNAFVGLLGVYDTSEWEPAHRARLERELGIELDKLPGPVLVAMEDWLEERIEEVNERDAMTAAVRDQAWTAAEFPVVAEWVQAQAEAFAKVAEAVRRPKYYAPLIRPTPRGSMIEVLLPQLGNSRLVARSLKTRMNLAVGNGDAEAALADLETLRRLADHVRAEPILISNLVGLSIDALAAESAQALLGKLELDVEQARRLIALMPTQAGGLSIADTIDLGERAMGMDSLDLAPRQMQADGKVEIDPIVHQEVGPLGPLTLHRLFDRDRAQSRFNGYYDRLTAIAQLSDLVAMHEQTEAFESELDELNRIPWVAKLRFDPMAGRSELLESSQWPESFTDHVVDLLAEALTPALSPAGRTERQAEMRRTLTRIAAALAGHRAEHGVFPETLEALTPDWLADLPRDFDGQPLRYRRDGVGYVRDGGGYLLYSVGRDLEDDLGEDTTGDGDMVIRVRR